MPYQTMIWSWPGPSKACLALCSTIFSGDFRLIRCQPHPYVFMNFAMISPVTASKQSIVEVLPNSLNLSHLMRILFVLQRLGILSPKSNQHFHNQTRCHTTASEASCPRYDSSTCQCLTIFYSLQGSCCQCWLVPDGLTCSLKSFCPHANFYLGFFFVFFCS